MIFVTGTDTGVGKTLLTASLLFHLRHTGVKALAMKPFCSGGTSDVDLIQAIQGSNPAREEVNPFYFAEPLAPLVAARKRRQRIRLPEVLRAIGRMEKQCDQLIVEGSGGLLVPLGERFTVAEVIANLDCNVVVVGKNQLGIINHALLTVEALRARGVTRLKVVLMGQTAADFSARSNAAILGEVLANIGIFTLPHLGAGATGSRAVKRNVGKIKKTLARILGPDSFTPRSSKGLQNQAAKRRG